MNKNCKYKSVNHKIKEASNGDLSRRQFIKASAAAITLYGCGGSKVAVSEPTAIQKAWKSSGKSIVGLIPIDSYEEDCLAIIKPYLSQLNLPDFKGKTVLIKPNMVEFQPGRPVWTNPAMLKNAVELVDYLGASKIIIGEGPGHMRDTEFLLNSTGIGQACKKLGFQFTDLNLDDIDKIENKDGFAKIPEFFLPKTLLEADAVVSLPKMKTHHWVGLTCSMKNMFGTVPGRKYGWPKNILHVKGITNCILDLVHLIKPAFGFVDAIEAMEGDGPINGTAKAAHFVGLSTDLAALDASCARTMSIDPMQLPYLKLAGQVIGNIDEANITVIGKTVSELRQKFELPITFSRPELLEQAKQQGS